MDASEEKDIKYCRTFHGFALLVIIFSNTGVLLETQPSYEEEEELEADSSKSKIPHTGLQ